MYHDTDDLKDLPETEQWMCKLFGHYALNLLKQAHPEPNEDSTRLNNLTVKVFFVCHDKRRTSTVHKRLAAVLKASPREDLEVLHEEYLKRAPAYAKAPTFDMSGTKQEGPYFNKKIVPLASPQEAYRHLGNLSYREAIYVQLHQNEYDFKLIRRKVRRTKYGPLEDSYKMKIFPTAPTVTDELEQAIYRSRLEQIISKYADVIVRQIYGLHIKYLQGEGEDYKESIPAVSLKIKGYDGYMEKELTQKIAATARAARIYRRASKELAALRQALRQAGGFNKEDVLKKLHRHLQEDAPLYINDEEHPEMKELATEMLQGKLTREISGI